MSNAIVTLIVVFLMLSGVALMAQSSFASMRDLSDSWKQMEVRSGDIARTKLDVLTTSQGAGLVNITLKNSGQVALLDFSKWDVMVQYYQSSGTYHVKRLTYTATNPPGNNEWTVVGIYVDAGAGTPEIFQPNILDPDEEIIIRFKLSPVERTSPDNLARISATNGVAVTAMF